MHASPAAPAVPCLAHVYLALGDDPPGEAAAPRGRRLAAAAAAGVLALGIAVWPLALNTAVTLERLPGTIPESHELTLDALADAAA